MYMRDSERRKRQVKKQGKLEQGMIEAKIPLKSLF